STEEKADEEGVCKAGIQKGRGPFARDGGEWLHRRDRQRRPAQDRRRKGWRRRERVADLQFQISLERCRLSGRHGSGCPESLPRGREHHAERLYGRGLRHARDEDDQAPLERRLAGNRQELAATGKQAASGPIDSGEPRARKKTA